MAAGVAEPTIIDLCGDDDQVVDLSSSQPIIDPDILEVQTIRRPNRSRQAAAVPHPPAAKRRRKSAGAAAEEPAAAAAAAAPPPEKKELTCCICLEKFDTPCCGNCGHLFCRPCITDWIKKNSKKPQCPTCRKTITLKQLRNVYYDFSA